MTTILTKFLRLFSIVPAFSDGNVYWRSFIDLFSIVVFATRYIKKIIFTSDLRISKLPWLKKGNHKIISEPWSAASNPLFRGYLVSASLKVKWTKIIMKKIPQLWEQQLIKQSTFLFVCEKIRSPSSWKWSILNNDGSKMMKFNDWFSRLWIVIDDFKEKIKFFNVRRAWRPKVAGANYALWSFLLIFAQKH